MKSFVLAAFLVLSFSVTTEARLFNLNKETFAGYFSVSGGSSMLGQGAYEDEAAGVTYNSKVRYNYGGEFGVVYAKAAASLRFGIEFGKPQMMENVKASNATDEVYTLKSDVTAIVPKITLDVNLRSNQGSRSFATVSAGYANVTVKNEYSLTAAGTAAYPGMDGTMEAKGTGTQLMATLGQEGFLSDNATYIFELGYKQLTVDNLKYSKDANLFGTSHSTGDAVNTSDGNARSMDLGGVIISLGLRFYL